MWDYRPSHAVKSLNSTRFRSLNPVKIFNICTKVLHSLVSLSVSLRLCISRHPNLQAFWNATKWSHLNRLCSTPSFVYAPSLQEMCGGDHHAVWHASIHFASNSLGSTWSSSNLFLHWSHMFLLFFFTLFIEYLSGTHELLYVVHLTDLNLDMSFICMCWRAVCLLIYD